MSPIPVSLELRFLRIPTRWARQKEPSSGHYMLVPKVDQRPERTLDVLKGDPRELRTEFLRLPHSESAALAFLEKIGLWGAEWDSEVALKYYSTQALNCESGDLL